MFPNHSKSMDESREEMERKTVSRVLAERIKGTGFDEISNLCSEWNEDAQHKVPILRTLLKNFENFYPPKEETSLGSYRETFGNYVKTLNILHGIGDLEAEEIYKSLYHNIQVALHEAIGEEESEEVDNPKLYIFYFESFSLLNPETRQTLSKNYREGKAPFDKDILKSNEYSKILCLSLSPKVFQ